jgi:hypothetical protein
MLRTLPDGNSNAESRQIMLDPIANQLSPCDWSSFSYFLLSFLLFAVGSILTFLSIDESNAANPFTRFWLVGPLFLCSGLVMATKTLIYLKSKNLIELLTRQSELCISAHEPTNWYTTSHREESDPQLSVDALANSLPPPYEAAVANSNSSIYITVSQHHNTGSLTSGRNSRLDTLRPASACNHHTSSYSDRGASMTAATSETIIVGHVKDDDDSLDVNHTEQPPPPYELVVK